MIFGLTLAILLGTFIGTYSSIYISAPVLVWLGLKPDSFLAEDEEAGLGDPADDLAGSAWARFAHGPSKPLRADDWRLAFAGSTLERFMVNKTRHRGAAAAARPRSSTAGCARNKAKGDTAYVARDVNTLYSLAKQRLDQGNYEVAAKLFDEVERQHPYSVWARRAQLMSAFSYYMAQKYPDAISSSQRFLTIHPGNKDAPYANYLIAMSYYQQIEDVSRDQKITPAGLGQLRRADPPLSVEPLRQRCAPEARPDQRSPRRQGNGSRSLLPALGQLACRGDCASARSSTNIRPPPTRPKRWSGWSRLISTSACPTKRASRRRCSAPTTPAASGTSAATT